MYSSQLIIPSSLASNSFHRFCTSLKMFLARACFTQRESSFSEMAPSLSTSILSTMMLQRDGGGGNVRVPSCHIRGLLENCITKLFFWEGGRCDHRLPYLSSVRFKKQTNITGTCCTSFFLFQYRMNELWSLALEKTQMIMSINRLVR